MLLCRYCGAAFPAKQWGQKYCAPRHRDAHHNEARRFVIDKYKHEVESRLEATRRDKDETTT